MSVKIQMWGNSHAVRLPKAIVEQARLTVGTPVEIATDNDTVTIRPSRRRRRIPISELVRGMTPAKNRYPEFETRRVGKETL